MPKDKKPLERYRRIHELFSRARGREAGIKLQDLADKLGISLRQLSDDMNYMRENGAPFEYVPTLRAWRYEEGRDFTMIEDQLLSDEDVLNIRIAIETFNKINNNDKAFGDLPVIFRKIYRASRKWTEPESPHKYIYFDPLPAYAGGKYLSFFLKAIEKSHRVSFQYLAFHAQAPKTVIFDPWFLRHYDRRWYVGGFSHDPAEQFVRTFPLDRIVEQPVKSGYYHDKPPQNNAETYWKHIYGITVPKYGKLENVLMEFTAIQGKYFLSTPFFEPYHIVEQTPDKLIIQLEIIPNIDLLRKLASLGPDVRVLAPASLALELQELHKQAFERYMEPI
jgi:predicted DNA-binding transcriptional regulator YafY